MSGANIPVPGAPHLISTQDKGSDVYAQNVWPKSDAYGKEFASRMNMAPHDAWVSPPRRLVFFAPDPADPPVVGRAAWQAPIFDLRPDVKTGGEGNFPQNTIPIWNAPRYGAGLYLHVFISADYLQGDGLEDISVALQLYSINLGNPYRSDITLALQQPENISADFFDGAQGVVISLEAPKYRFWKPELRFDQMDGVLNVIGTTLFVSAALY